MPACGAPLPDYSREDRRFSILAKDIDPDAGITSIPKSLLSFSRNRNRSCSFLSGDNDGPLRKRLDFRLKNLTVFAVKYLDLVR